MTPSRYDDLVEHNRRYASTVHDPDIPGRPSGRLAVVTCMDCRIDPVAVLGLGPGEAHVLRNAGGVVTDDVVRSLCLSQRFLGTTDVVLVHHTDCGLQKVDEEAFRDELASECGHKPPWSVEAFSDPYTDVEQSMSRIRAEPFLAGDTVVRGFVFDVTDGLLYPVAS